MPKMERYYVRISPVAGRLAETQNVTQLLEIAPK